MKITGLRLCIATSKLIRQWAQRRLPNGKIIRGEILNPKTVNYQTLKPERDGLFCERIFGPINDSLCACGRPPLRGQKFCSRCEVEYISTRVRRYRLGYIQLITAGAHVWFLKGNYFSLFFNLPKKKIECLIYCTQNISRTIFGLSPPPSGALAKRGGSAFFGGGEGGGASFSLNCSFKKPITLLQIQRPFLEMSEILHWLAGGSRSERSQRERALSPPFGGPLALASLRAGAGEGEQGLAGAIGPPSGARSLREPPIRGSRREQSQSPSNHFQRPASAKPNGASEKWTNLDFDPRSEANASRRSQKIYLKIKVLGQSPRAPYRGKKSLWQNGGLRDSALYFGISLISKMSSWFVSSHWFCFLYFISPSPPKGDILNKWYPGPPGLVNFWGFHSRLFCFTGIQLMRTWLTQLTQNKCYDGRLLEIQIRLDLLQLEHAPAPPAQSGEFVYKVQLFRRLKYLRSFRHTQLNPASMILSVLPVLPPDLRPILELENNQIAISDFNKLYQTILFRNRRLSRLTMDPNLNFHCLNSEALQYGQRLLQESIDDLIENGDKSLSDLFKGKKGRFRQNLLGKRVDYSGRSVIVVGPQLKIYECGLPKKIAYELFQPFILRILLKRSLAKTVLGAKKLYKKLPSTVIWNLVQGSLREHPILLNRAPTLHRLSIQAFKPRLINGKAVLLHPLVCSAFNADFDGDQMGIHLPLCFEARAEAWKIAWSQNNLFSVATSSPVCSPSQDMILGSSFLTIGNTLRDKLRALSTLTFYAAPSQREPRHALPGAQIAPRSGVAPPAKLRFAPACTSLQTSKALSASLRASAFGVQRSEPVGRPQSGRQHGFPKGTSAGFEPLSASLRATSGMVRGSPKGRKPKQRSDQRQQRFPGSPIWVTYNSDFYGFETDHKKQKLIEIRVNINGYFQKFRSQFYQQHHSSSAKLLRKIRTTYGRMKFFQSI
uniref:DNA-directed RNA polymerase subunit n=1 Tax=Halimeda minima TaxID=170427 RepID=A0A386AYS6_9CHLO|nr:RNA polymerase b-subunit [Halimeda minima]